MVAHALYAQCRACEAWGYDHDRGRCIDCGALAHAAEPLALRRYLDALQEHARQVEVRRYVCVSTHGHDLDVPILPYVEMRAPLLPVEQRARPQAVEG